jgi:hypothetical protein
MNSLRVHAGVRSEVARRRRALAVGQRRRHRRRVRPGYELRRGIRVDASGATRQ